MTAVTERDVMEITKSISPDAPEIRASGYTSSDQFSGSPPLFCTMEYRKFSP
jgi:hypothetical protein